MGNVIIKIRCKSDHNVEKRSTDRVQALLCEYQLFLLIMFMRIYSEFSDFLKGHWTSITSIFKI